MSDAMGTRNREELEFTGRTSQPGQRWLYSSLASHFNTKTPAQLAPCWCPLLHSLSPEDHEGAEKRSVTEASGPHHPFSPLSYRKLVLACTPGEGAFRQELALLHPRSADKLSVCSPKLAFCLWMGKTAGRRRGGGGQHHSGPAPLARRSHPAPRLKAPCAAWAPASSPVPALALLPGTGAATARCVHRPTGPPAMGTGPAPSSP